MRGIGGAQGVPSDGRICWKGFVPSGKSVRVQCLQCGHFSVLSPDMLSRLAIAHNTPIAAFVKRLRCRKCGSQSVLATRKPPQQQAVPITKR